MNEMQDWDEVIASERYQSVVAPVFEPLGMNCKDWPDGLGANSYYCEECVSGNS
jgi:hypothetical protein